MPTYNREGSKLRAAALAVLAAAVPNLTFAGHAAATTINYYNALKAITKRVAGVTVRPEKERPCVILQTLDGMEIVKTLNNKRVPLILLVETNADADEDKSDDDPEANHDALVAAVFDGMNDEAIVASLTAAVSEFTVFDVIDMGELDVEAEDGALKTAHRWDVICANSSL